MGGKNTTKIRYNREIKRQAFWHHVLHPGAKPTCSNFYQQSFAVRYKIHLRPSWPAMILVSAPARRSRVNLQTSPLPLSTEDVAHKKQRDNRRCPAQCTASESVHDVKSLIRICGDANLVDVIVVKKAVHSHWQLATSSTSWRNRESPDAHALWNGNK